MSISLACVLEVARAIDVLVHSAGVKRPSKSFVESQQDPRRDSKDKTGVGSEAMKDRETVNKSPGEGENIFVMIIVNIDCNREWREGPTSCPQAPNRTSSNLNRQIDLGPGTGHKNLPKYWQFWPRHKNKM